MKIFRILVDKQILEFYEVQANDFDEACEKIDCGEVQPYSTAEEISYHLEEEEDLSDNEPLSWEEEKVWL